jgi:POT family proton-dependent oligopeptide transporter
VVAVATVQSLEAEHAIKLLPEAFDLEKANEVADTKVIPMEKVAISSIVDIEVKEAVKRTVETSLVENPKFFLGFKILTLYDFFMLFVFMAGAASVVLFFLSSKMLKMMGGIR